MIIRFLDEYRKDSIFSKRVRNDIILLHNVATNDYYRTIHHVLFFRLA